MDPMVEPMLMVRETVVDANGPGNRDDDITAALGRNLRRLRTRRGLSLERLARLSGVSRAMLGQIELGRSVPTILLLNKVAQALGAPLTAFIAAHGRSGLTVLRREEARVLSSIDGGFRARTLAPAESPANGGRSIDFVEIRLRAGAEDRAAAHPAGTVKNLALAQGLLEIEAGGEGARLRDGDAVSFAADRPHVVRNIGDGEAVFYVVTAHSDPSS